MKKYSLVSLVLVFSLTFSTVAQAVFQDLPSAHPNFDAVTYVQSEGIVEGYEDGTFRPDSKINRAEFTKIVMESAYPDSSSGEGCFSDVADEWFAKYVCDAKLKAIINGYPDGTFKPAQNISFVEAAKIIVLAYQVEVTADAELWYRPFVEYMGENKAIPFSIDRLEHELTRGEMAEMIFRLETGVDKLSQTYESLVGVADTPIEPVDEEPLADACINGGTQLDIMEALDGAGAVATLCKNALFTLTAPVKFSDEGQSIVTDGLPKGDERATLRIASGDAATAIDADGYDKVEIKSLIVDGNRADLGTAEGALIEFGDGIAQVVEDLKAFDPRGESILMLAAGADLSCASAQVRNNQFGPGGNYLYGLASGISLACRNSVVENNVITDVTDGGIVIHQAPGSLVRENQIVAETNPLQYGISMTSYAPFDGKFTETVVQGNTVEALGALIKVAVAMGDVNTCFDSENNLSHKFNTGAIVKQNTLKGEMMGYGFVAEGVKDWIAVENIDLSTHVSPSIEAGAGCFGATNPPPVGFIIDADYARGGFQSDFLEEDFGMLLDVWKVDKVVDQACVRDLVGTEVFEAIKSGSRGPVWEALKAATNGPKVASCISVYEPPEIAQQPQNVVLGSTYGVRVNPMTCVDNVLTVRVEPLVYMNLFSKDSFVLMVDDFIVDCAGLPDIIRPQQKLTCTISDFVATGLHHLDWYGVPTVDTDGEDFECTAS